MQENLVEDKEVTSTTVKKKKGFSLGYKRGFYILVFMFAIFAIFMLVPKNYYLFLNVASEKNKNVQIENIDKLQKLNYDDSKGIVKELKNFSLSENTLPFKNFATDNSNGVCEGFSLFEKFAYMDKLKNLDVKVNGNTINVKNIDVKHLGDYNLSENDVYLLYRKAYNSQYCLFYNKDSQQSAQQLYDKSIEKKKLQDFTNVKFTNDRVNLIVNTINYLQVDYNKKHTLYLPESYGTEKFANDYESVVLAEKLNKKNAPDVIKESVNPKDITEKIDNDEPVVISIVNQIGDGHAVLGYKYETVNDKVIKVYVHDPNMPYIRDDKYKNLSDEISKKAYILFTKDVNGKWAYKYDPYVDGCSLYKGIYNSFIPSTRLLIE